MAVNRMMIQILEDSDRRPSLAIQHHAAKKGLNLYLPERGVFFLRVDGFTGVRSGYDQNSSHGML